MAEFGTAVPAGGETPEPDERAPRPRSAASELGWGLVSTAVLALWIAWQWGWIWALAGVFGILVHETGHLVVINALGCGPSRIHIIPFFGGAATMKRAPRTEFHGVLIALAGPFAGLAASLPFFILAGITQDVRWQGGAFFIAVLNLVNLAPAPPLDGSKALGPALAWIHPWLERAALVLVGGAAALWAFHRGSLLFGTFVAIASLAALRGRGQRPPAVRLSTGEWLGAIGLWLATLALGLAVLQFSVGGGGAAGVLGAIRQAGLQ
ncbi:MAG: peptidase M50 [Caulobacteraceae bacterium]|nr:peptidase M50 [Caulobacteraceae bacterium]